MIHNKAVFNTGRSFVSLALTNICKGTAAIVPLNHPVAVQSSACQTPSCTEQRLHANQPAGRLAPCLLSDGDQGSSLCARADASQTAPKRSGGSSPTVTAWDPLLPD